MFEIRFHGRGGQGAVTSAELLAIGAIAEGKYAQAFPSFGPERRGAPVIAFSRVSDRAIRLRNKVEEPDAVVVLDPSLLSIVKVDAGMTENSVIVINSAHPKEQLAELTGVPVERIATVNASHIAREEIGRVITNTTMLGALVRVTGIVGTEAIVDALQARFGRIAEGNIKAFKRAQEEVVLPGNA